jgi:hypothetical protein
MPESPTSRTLRECRKRGWMAYVCEKYSHHTRRRYDAFGFGDVLAVDPGRTGAVLIQATSGDNVASRVKKICGECSESAALWLSAGNAIEVWGWRKVGPRGKRKLWDLRTVVVTSADIHPAT